MMQGTRWLLGATMNCLGFVGDSYWPIEQALDAVTREHKLQLIASRPRDAEQSLAYRRCEIGGRRPAHRLRR